MTMNGLEVRKVYYNLDGSADWLKSIARTVYICTDERPVTVACLCLAGEIGLNETVVCVETLAAQRALDLYCRKIALEV